jgi:hypothetical protein
MSWPNRGLDTEQTGYPVTSLSSLRPTDPRLRVAGTRKRRHLSIEEPRGFPLKSLKAASTAGRRPPKKMNDMPVTPSTQPSESYNDMPTVSPSGGSNFGASLRKERGAIAAQVSEYVTRTS